MFCSGGRGGRKCGFECVSKQRQFTRNIRRKSVVGKVRFIRHGFDDESTPTSQKTNIVQAAFEAEFVVDAVEVGLHALSRVAGVGHAVAKVFAGGAFDRRLLCGLGKSGLLLGRIRLYIVNICSDVCKFEGRRRVHIGGVVDAELLYTY